MGEYLCDMLGCDICACGLSIKCVDCPFNVVTEWEGDPTKYLEDIKQRVERAISLLKEG